MFTAILFVNSTAPEKQFPTIEQTSTNYIIYLNTPTRMNVVITRNALACIKSTPQYQALEALEKKIQGYCVPPDTHNFLKKMLQNMVEESKLILYAEYQKIKNAFTKEFLTTPIDPKTKTGTYIDTQMNKKRILQLKSKIDHCNPNNPVIMEENRIALMHLQVYNIKQEIINITNNNPLYSYIAQEIKIKWLCNACQKILTLSAKGLLLSESCCTTVDKNGEMIEISIKASKIDPLLPTQQNKELVEANLQVYQENLEDLIKLLKQERLKQKKILKSSLPSTFSGIEETAEQIKARQFQEQCEENKNKKILLEEQEQKRRMKLSIKKERENAAIELKVAMDLQKAQYLTEKAQIETKHRSEIQAFDAKIKEIRNTTSIVLKTAQEIRDYISMFCDALGYKLEALKETTGSHKPGIYNDNNGKNAIRIEIPNHPGKEFFINQTLDKIIQDITAHKTQKHNDDIKKLKGKYADF